MTLQVTVNDIILLEDNLINEGEYNVKTINFEFSNEYTGLIKKCRFITDEEIYEEDILDNQCEIPIQVTSESGYIRIGVYAYNEIDGTLELRYSPTPLKYLVRSGSYTEDEVIVPERLIVIEQSLDSDSEAHVPSVHAVKQAIDQLDVSGFEAGENITFEENIETGKTIINATDTIYDDTEIRGELSNKVDKVAGKGLSTNDYTTDEKTKLASLENYDDTQVKSDITSLETNKADKSTTYTKSEVDSLIPDVSNFITKNVDDLTYYTLATDTGHSIELSINSSTYVVTLNLKNSAGTTISTDTIDLPLESVVVNGSYDSTNKKIVLTLQSGSTIDIPVGDLVSGLQSEITSNNKLSSDLVDDTNKTNLFVTSSEKTTWNNKSDFSGNYNDLSNKPTIPSALSDLSDDTTHRVVTDTEKTTWSGKQDELLSGTNIKTINNTSILGSGNIDTEIIQYATMPTANADNLGKIVQFTGTTDSTYTNGYFYKCVSDGQATPTYSWENVLVQAGGSSLPKMVVINRSNYNTSAIISAVDVEYQKYLNGEEPCIYCYDEQNATTQAFGTQKLRVWSTSTTTFNLKSDFIITDKVDNFTTVDNTQLVQKTTGKLYVNCTVTSGHITAISIPSYENMGMITSSGSSYTLMTWSSTGARFLAKNNTNSYTPTGDYNPATKKYVDDTQRKVITSSTSTYTIASLTGNKTYKLGEITSLTITSTTTFDDETNIYFTSGSTATDISIPSALTNLGDVPTLTASGGANIGTCETSKNYIVSICNNIAIWKAY